MSFLEDCSKGIREVYVGVMKYGMKSSRLDWKNGVELTDEEVSWIEWLREQGFNYLVRELSGELVAFAAMPTYEEHKWISPSNCCVIKDKKLFEFTIGPGNIDVPVYIEGSMARGRRLDAR